MMPGTLTLKGGVSLKKAKKKKKKKKKNKADKKASGAKDDGHSEAVDLHDGATDGAAGGKRNGRRDESTVAKKKRKISSREQEGIAKTQDKRTAAEKAMEKAQAEREEQRMRKSAALSYREKVDKFNKYLESLSSTMMSPRLEMPAWAKWISRVT